MGDLHKVILPNPKRPGSILGRSGSIWVDPGEEKRYKMRIEERSAQVKAEFEERDAPRERRRSREGKR